MKNKNLIFHFQVHQPLRLAQLHFLDMGNELEYFDEKLNKEILERISNECYLPTNQMLRELVTECPAMRLTYSISGVALKQFETHMPAVLQSFQDLHATGKVEMLGETSHHSLCGIEAEQVPEFIEQVGTHSLQVEQLFGKRPAVFRNTEHIYNNTIGTLAAQQGYKGIITDGVERILGDRSTYKLYHHPTESNLKIFLRANQLSDDIGFRFTQSHGSLTADTYYNWLNSIPDKNAVILISFDYETLGEHLKAGTGIRDFLRDLILMLNKSDDIVMATPSEVLAAYPEDTDPLDVRETISWADKAKDVSAWMANELQQDAFHALYSLRDRVLKTGDTQIIETWRNLQTSDHFYYMSMAGGEDGAVHHYFSPYRSPYDAYINYMNVLSDFMQSLNRSLEDETKVESDEFERQHRQIPKWAQKLGSEIIEDTSIIRR
jgi:alpha-amylase